MTDFGKIKEVDVPGPMRIKLVNYTDENDESFVMCKSGLPGIAEDHVVHVGNDGVERQICADKARALIEPIADWPIPTNWEQITDTFKAENARRKIVCLDDNSFTTLYKMEAMRDIKKYWKIFPEEDKERVLDILPQLLDSKDKDIAAEAAFLAYDKLDADKYDPEKLDMLLIERLIAASKDEFRELTRALEYRPRKLSERNQDRLLKIACSPFPDYDMEKRSRYHKLRISTLMVVGARGLGKSARGILSSTINEPSNVTMFNQQELLDYAIDTFMAIDTSFAIKYLSGLYVKKGPEERNPLIYNMSEERNSLIMGSFYRLYVSYGNRWNKDREALGEFLLSTLNIGNTSSFFCEKIVGAFPLELSDELAAKIASYIKDLENSMRDMDKEEVYCIYSRELIKLLEEALQKHAARKAMPILKRAKEKFKGFIDKANIFMWGKEE